MTSATQLNYRLKGRLALQFKQASSANKTILHITEQTPPLRVIRAFHDKNETALVHLHNISGGVLGGDHLTLTVAVGSGGQAQLTTTGATRIYRQREGWPDAVQENYFTVEADGLLEYLPDPLIPFAQARYRQTTRVELAAGAGLFWWEIVAPGREAYHERFAYDLLEMKVDIMAGHRPVAIERARLQPKTRPLTSPMRLGPYRYTGAFYICRAGQPQAVWNTLEQELSELAQRDRLGQEIVWGVSMLPQDGVVIKGLGCSSRAIQAKFFEIWQLARLRLYNKAANPPRKLY
jgi:urease accessory protein